jgi:hypothetical protein
MDNLLLEEHVEASQAHSTQFLIVLTNRFFVNTQEFCKFLRAKRPAQLFFENVH